MESPRSYLGEGTRAALEPLRSALTAAGVEAAIAPPPPGCGAST